MAKKNPYSPDDPFNQHDFSWQNGRQDQSQEHRENPAPFPEGKAQEPHLDTEMPPYDPTFTAGGLGGLFADAGTGSGGHEIPDASQALQDFSATISDEELARLCEARLANFDWPGKKEAEDMRLRAIADIDNARKRLAREKEEAVRFASEAVLNDILPTLDTLDLALAHADKTGPAKDLVMGIEMTRKMLLDALAKHGLHPVGAIGETFDPSVHEAVGMSDDPAVENGQVCALLSNGYQLKDRLLRPAKVMVCKR